MRLLVRSITLEAEDIVSFELVDPGRLPLPPFDAGSHVDIAMTNGESRPYSLCNDPAETDRYRIAVLREVAGRGGSRFMHENVRVGQMLDLSLPRNNFALAAGARRHRLIAGGIGITPLLSMAHALDRRGDPYELHYCARSPSRTAFRDELAQLSGGAVSLHYDNGDPARGLDVFGLLRRCRRRDARLLLRAARTDARGVGSHRALAARNHTLRTLRCAGCCVPDQGHRRRIRGPTGLKRRGVSGARRPLDPVGAA